MRKVFEHPAFHEVGLLESVLNSHDIATIIRNQNVSSLAGEVPFTAAYPELWIVDDNRYDDAIAVLQDFREGARQDAPAVDWACPDCGESVPGTFHSCWKCDSPKPTNLA
jgi:hypothetical protein